MEESLKGRIANIGGKVDTIEEKVATIKKEVATIREEVATREDMKNFIEEIASQHPYSEDVESIFAGEPKS